MGLVMTSPAASAPAAGAAAGAAGRGYCNRRCGRCCDSGSCQLIFVHEHGLALLYLYLVYAVIESYFVFHLSLTSLMDLKRSSFKGFPSLSATMAMTIAASLGSVS